jgi:hypothetical protein
MVDLRTTIIPKSDQLNADDFIGNIKTITVRAVEKTQTAEQPVNIYYDGDNGKPYKPCKSMRRVLVHNWGADGALYVGRSMTLYRDDKVRFGGLDVGGIRISHMSHINEPVTMALTATKQSRKPYTVLPLVVESKQEPVSPEDYFALLTSISAAQSLDELAGIRKAGDGLIVRLKATQPDLHKKLAQAHKERGDALKNPAPESGEDTAA